MMAKRGTTLLIQIAFSLSLLLMTPWAGAPRSAQGQSQGTNYGANVSGDLGTVKTAELGFGWVRIYYPEQVDQAERYGLKILLLVGWDRALTDVVSWGDSIYNLVSRYRGRIAAYQICNEPNLAEMWHKPNYAEPAEYVAYLREAYRRAKQADPGCIIVTAGMATNGGYGNLAMDDVQFIRGMYAAGAKPYFDVLGSHPYGFGYAPEDSFSNPILCFRRVEQQRAVMVQYGDAAKPIWATEFGWIIDPGEGCHYSDDWPSRWWQRVSPGVQASYLVRACRYARTNWPWMGVMFLWNMDYSTAPWNTYCDQKCWFAVLNHDGSPRPGYSELARMVQGTPTPTPTATNPAFPTETTTPSATETPWPGSAIVVGRAVLEGRSNYSGAVAAVGDRSATTADDGAFRILGVSPGTHDFWVQMPGYLQHRQQTLSVRDHETITLPEILLRAGDVNGDNAVNLFDLVTISTRYDAQMPYGSPEDVNGDRVVNLLDLVLVSTNYGAQL